MHRERGGRKAVCGRQGKAGWKIKPRRSAWAVGPQVIPQPQCRREPGRRYYKWWEPRGAVGSGGRGCHHQLGLSAHLHLIIAVAWLLHAVALGQLLVQLGTCHPAVRCTPCGQRHRAGCGGDGPCVSSPELQENQTCRDSSGSREQRRALPKLTISQSRTPNDHLKGQETRL